MDKYKDWHIKTKMVVFIDRYKDKHSKKERKLDRQIKTFNMNKKGREHLK